MEQLLTSEEVAEFLHVDPVTIRRLINKGELSAYKIGSDYRIAPLDLTRYLQRQRVTATEENKDPGNPLDQLTRWAQKRLHFTMGSSIVMAEAQQKNRFDKFTKRARKVLSLAQDEAKHFQHNYVGTEHLLLGLLREGEGVAAYVLQRSGANLEKIRASVESIIGTGNETPIGDVGLTPRAKKVIELAVDEARTLKHQYIGTEHLLLGLIREGKGIAANVLESQGLKLEELRRETLNALQSFTAGNKGASNAPKENGEVTEEQISCPTCGVESSTEAAYCYKCGAVLPGAIQENNNGLPSTDESPEQNNTETFEEQVDE